MYEKLIEFRRAAGFTQDELAEKMDMHLSTYNKLEKGELRLRVEHLVKLHEVYNVPIDKLIFGAELPETGTGRWVKVYEIDDDEGLVEVDEVFGASGSASAFAFAIIMNDASMIGVINQDDRCLIEPNIDPSPGDIVLAKASTGEIVLRRFGPLHASDARAPGYILRPSNNDFPEIVDTEKKGGEIMGVLRIRQEIF